MSPYQLRVFKRAFRRFWKEWGISKTEMIDLTAGCCMIGSVLIIMGIFAIL